MGMNMHFITFLILLCFSQGNAFLFEKANETKKSVIPIVEDKDIVKLVEKGINGFPSFVIYEQDVKKSFPSIVAFLTSQGFITTPCVGNSKSASDNIKTTLRDLKAQRIPSLIDDTLNVYLSIKEAKVTCFYMRRRKARKVTGLSCSKAYLVQLILPSSSLTPSNPTNEDSNNNQSAYKFPNLVIGCDYYANS
eukprot:TRINITY_DN12447_c0_g1_i1.p1 TRINITY_DN12447_c0_g1~~TRINITY_DN12447_c0_g1_i1.p1  ORF type:complete len:193 (+),score=17.61 TRINITY_DN12447_c0_g1_i1:99-677(+)